MVVTGTLFIGVVLLIGLKCKKPTLTEPTYLDLELCDTIHNNTNDTNDDEEEICLYKQPPPPPQKKTIRRSKRITHKVHNV